MLARRARALRSVARAFVGDTVGDPFEDTAGPSIHVPTKLVATIMLVMAPFLA